MNNFNTLIIHLKADIIGSLFLTLAEIFILFLLILLISVLIIIAINNYFALKIVQFEFNYLPMKRIINKIQNTSYFTMFNVVMLLQLNFNYIQTVQGNNIIDIIFIYNDSLVINSQFILIKTLVFVILYFIVIENIEDYIEYKLNNKFECLYVFIKYILFLIVIFILFLLLSNLTIMKLIYSIWSIFFW